jgi:hypothetical protein
MLEVRVLEAAVAWFEEDESHYTPEVYLRTESGDETPGREVVAACAIGGVEQAVWMVTGKSVIAERSRLAYIGKGGEERQTPGDADTLNEQHEVYWRVMRRLNLEAVSQRKEGVFAEFEDEGYEINDVEDVTELGDHSRELMLDVFRAALAQAKAATRNLVSA